MSQVISTTTALELLFEQVVKRFGPFSKWKPRTIREATSTMSTAPSWRISRRSSAPTPQTRSA